ncbi:hypothetical protein F4802DRAFT_555264 [Xylaria palmicola]|nr:hypothetical protein F4802DRAFT_555264 [Xylaria palmicola]
MPDSGTQKRVLHDRTGYCEDDYYGVHTKKPCLTVGLDHPRLPEVTYSLDTCNDAKGRQASKSEDICFGMLKDIQIRLNYEQDAYTSTLDKSSRDDNNFIALQLQFLEDRCDVLRGGVPFATMGMKLHLALKSLSSAEMLSYKGMVLQSELRQKFATVAKFPRIHPSKIDCNMSLIILGPRSVKDTIAKELARFRLFLQHPIPMLEGIAYENPQYLSTVASRFGNGVILPPIQIEVSHRDFTGASALDPDEQTTIATVLDNLPQHNYVRNLDIDKRIRTILLSHQTEAVNFIMSRESGEKQGKTLWEIVNFNTEKSMYRHIITGATSPRPNDILGGILGDGMGLGKTLSMIACIVSSQAHADELMNGPSNKDLSGTMPPAPVGSTLVIVPSILLLDAWMDEIRKHVVPGTLSVYKYHGPNRKLPSSPPLPYDIVLSTYGTVAADFSRGGGVLTCFHWYRIILDEAHVIRNWSTKQFKAMNGLSASIRWCVTGTPVQNSLKDLASLITFLRLPLLDDPTIFRKHIEGSRENQNGVTKPNYRNLRHLLESICLRRCTSSILSALGVSFTEHRPDLSESERKGYAELSMVCDRYIKAAVNGKSSKAGNKSIFVAVLRLRMFCNTGALGPIDSHLKGIDNEDELMPDEVISLLQQCGQTVCTSCKTEVSCSDTDANFGRPRGPARDHLKCGECNRRALNTQNKSKTSNDLEKLKSPVSGDMMQGIQFEQDHRSGRTENTFHQTSYPSKVLSLVDDIRAHYNHDKSIVFSFWRRSLDLVEKLFTEQGITFSRVDGSIHAPKRSEVLKTFQENPSIRVLLMTIGTGAVGLNNLSVASRVHILEPQWNPSIEDQAIGRVVRLGQNKKVTVIRYIVKNTIEESIESRQLQKLQLTLKSGLKTSNQDHSEGQRRIEHLQTLGRIIESTAVCRTGGSAVSESIRSDGY